MLTRILVSVAFALLVAAFVKYTLDGIDAAVRTIGR